MQLRGTVSRRRGWAVSASDHRNRASRRSQRRRRAREHASEIYRLQIFCEKNNIRLVVIGPEETPAAGMADVAFGPVRSVFGLVAAAARPRGRQGPGASSSLRGRRCRSRRAVRFRLHGREKTLRRDPRRAAGRQASGLCKGKGVIVPSSIDEAVAALDRM